MGCPIRVWANIRIWGRTRRPEDRGNHEAIWKVRPLITPDAFNGKAFTSWDEWVGHIESVAKVNCWDEASQMTRKAQNAWKQLSREAKAQYETTKLALHKRFEPDSR